jgi:hypothetical protein
LDETSKTAKDLSGLQGGANTRTKRKVDQMTKNRPEGMEFAALIPRLRDSTAPLRDAAQRGLEGVSDWLSLANRSRWTKPKSLASAAPIQTREGNLQALRESLQEFRDGRHTEVLEPFKHMFDPTTGQLKMDKMQNGMASGRELFRCYVFSTCLIAFSITVIELLELVLEIEKANPKPKIQLPAAFARKLVQAANGQNGGGNPLDMGAKSRGTEDDSNSTDTLVNEEDQDEDVDHDEKHGDGKKKKKAKAKRVYCELYLAVFMP